jgi:hypothetical protein
MKKQEMDYDQEKQGSPSWTLMLGGSRMLPREVSNKTWKAGRDLGGILWCTFKVWRVCVYEEYVFKCKWFEVNLAGANCTIVQDECGHTRLKTSATTVKDICHQLSAISLANFRAIYFSQSCRTMLLSSLSPKPRGQSRSILGEKPEVVFTTFDMDDDHV